MPIFALYNFDDTGLVAADSALSNGAQDGEYFDGAAPVGGRAVLDGINDKVKIYPNSEFQLSRGTLEIQFSQSAQGAAPATVLSRDSVGETSGGYRIEVLADGSVLISHESGGTTTAFQTEAGFVNPGDEVNITYSWDEATGGTVQISNLTTDDGFEDAVPAGLTMNQGQDSQPWMIGAGQSLSDPGILNNLNNHFQGSVEVFSLSDTVDNFGEGPVANPDTAETDEDTPVVVDLIGNDTDVDNPNADLLISGTPTSADGRVVVNADGRSVTFTPNPGFTGAATINYTVTDPSGLTDDGVATIKVAGGGRDGIVRGTETGDLIDAAYIDPFDGDRVDAGDAILDDDAPNDDRILAGAGDDTVFAGLGDDTVSAGTGDDLIYGGAGNDSLRGGAGDDTLNGGDSDDFIRGGLGNDHIFGGTGVDTLFGGADRDDFTITSGQGAGSAIYGGAAGDDFDRLVIRGAPESYRIVETGPDGDGNGINGRVDYLDTAGNITGSVTFENIEEIKSVPCFTPGTLIATPKGEVPVEQLKAGDRIITRDNGIQELRWTGQRKFDWAHLTANPHLRPIMVRRGSLGNGLPERDMMLSPNHRVLVSNDRTSLYFDEHEVLVSAKHLVGGKGIFEVESIGTAYIHLLFDQHEVVLSDGAWTESFQPGDYSLNGMGNAQRNEIYELFPELKTKAGLEDYSAARRTLKKYEAKLLVR